MWPYTGQGVCRQVHVAHCWEGGLRGAGQGAWALGPGCAWALPFRRVPVRVIHFPWGLALANGLCMASPKVHVPLHGPAG